MSVIIDYGTLKDSSKLPYQDFSAKEIKCITKYFPSYNEFTKEQQAYLQSIKSKNIAHMTKDLAYFQSRLDEARAHTCLDRNLSMAIAASKAALLFAWLIVAVHAKYSSDDLGIKLALAVPPILFILIGIFGFRHFELICNKDCSPNPKDHSMQIGFMGSLLVPKALFASCLIPQLAFGREKMLEKSIKILQASLDQQQKVAKTFTAIQQNKLKDDVYSVLHNRLLLKQLEKTQSLPESLESLQACGPQDELPFFNYEANINHLKQMDLSLFCGLLLTCYPMLYQIWQKLASKQYLEPKPSAYSLECLQKEGNSCAKS